MHSILHQQAQSAASALTDDDIRCEQPLRASDGNTTMVHPHLPTFIRKQGVGLVGMSSAGYCAGFLDVSKTSVGLVFSMSNTFATIPGIISPTITEAILYPDGEDSAVAAPAANWRVVFYLAAAINVAATVVYMVFGKASHVAALD
jgi:hypothetical protein